MARPKSKKELIDLSYVKYEELWNLINSMTEIELNTEFDFSKDIKKKETHWKRDKNLRDILIHLYEWHQLLINWIRQNKDGNKSHFLPKPYNWQTYGEMNVELWKKHQTTELKESKEMFVKSHKSVINIIETFSDKELFTKKLFDWTGSTSLGSYCISSTSSHYDWAIKKIRTHIKMLKTNNVC